MKRVVAVCVLLLVCCAPDVCLGAGKKPLALPKEGLSVPKSDPLEKLRENAEKIIGKVYPRERSPRRRDFDIGPERIYVGAPYRMPVIKPDAGADYHMPSIAPDPGVQYRTPVIREGTELPRGFLKMDRESPGNKDVRIYRMPDTGRRDERESLKGRQEKDESADKGRVFPDDDKFREQPKGTAENREGASPEVRD